jgi:hypothetical protein
MAARLDPLLDETNDRARFVAALGRVASRLDADHAERRAATSGATGATR